MMQLIEYALQRLFDFCFFRHFHFSCNSVYFWLSILFSVLYKGQKSVKVLCVRLKIVMGHTHKTNETVGVEYEIFQSKR